MQDELKIGDLVQIIGPDIDGNLREPGRKFVISQRSLDGKNYSRQGLHWFPASSLRLVEELKMGDWVRIDNPEFKSYGEIFQISGVLLERTGTYLSDAPNKRHFAGCHLRKLTPLEIQRHEIALYKESKTCRFDLSCPLILDGDCDGTGKNCSEHSMVERLSAIEKRQAEIDEGLDEHRQSHAQWANRVIAIDKKLVVLEGERPEVCESCVGNGRIHISIERNGRGWYPCGFDDPQEAKEWCERTLDIIRRDYESTRT